MTARDPEHDDTTTGVTNKALWLDLRRLGFQSAADRIMEQAAEIVRLRAALAATPEPPLITRDVFSRPELVQRLRIRGDQDSVRAADVIEGLAEAVSDRRRAAGDHPASPAEIDRLNAIIDRLQGDRDYWEAQCRAAWRGATGDHPAGDWPEGHIDREERLAAERDEYKRLWEEATGRGPVEPERPEGATAGEVRRCIAAGGSIRCAGQFLHVGFVNDWAAQFPDDTVLPGVEAVPRLAPGEPPTPEGEAT